jgi:hypothetical protein
MWTNPSANGLMDSLPHYIKNLLMGAMEGSLANMEKCSLKAK